LDFFENNDPFFYNFNIDNIGNFDDNNNLHQHQLFNNDENKLDKIQISKRVKSVRQLKNTDKELLLLNYKEAILKGLG
jgi:hypothetical protein